MRKTSAPPSPAGKRISLPSAWLDLISAFIVYGPEILLPVCVVADMMASIAWLDVLCVVKSRLNILRPLERFSLFRDVLPERVGQIGRDVMFGFSGEAIEKRPVFITDPAPREPPESTSRPVCSRQIDL